MPWSCFVCDGRGGAACPGHGVTQEGSEHHNCPTGGGHKWFCNRMDCRGHSGPGPDLAPPGPVAGFSASQRCPNDPGSMWYCRARGCTGHLSQGQTCLDMDQREDAARARDGARPKFLCRWTGCGGHESPHHFHTPAEVQAAEAVRAAPSRHAAAINRTSALAPPSRLQVGFKLFNYVYLDNFRTVTAHDEYVSDEQLWSESQESGEPRTNWMESLWYSLWRTGPGPRRGYRGSGLRPVCTADQFRTLWGSRFTARRVTEMPAGHGPDSLSVWGSSSAFHTHYLHIFPVSPGSSELVQVGRARIVEYRGERDWTETDASGEASRGAGGRYYTLLPDARYFIVSLPFKLSASGMGDLAVLMDYSLSTSGDDRDMFRVFSLDTTASVLAGDHGAQRMDVDFWVVPVVNPFHVALSMAALAYDRCQYLRVIEPQRGDSGLNAAERKRRYAAIFTDLVGSLARSNSDFAETLNLEVAGNDCKMYSLYHRRAAGGLIIAMAYLLNSRPVLEIEYLTSRYPEEMRAGGGWWVMLLGEVAKVLTRHTAGIEVFRLRDDGKRTGDFVSPISRWLNRYIEPTPATLSGPALPQDQPTGAADIIGYIGSAGDVANTLYEAWSHVEVLRQGLEGGMSASSFNSRMHAAAEALRERWSQERFWGSRVAVSGTWISRSASLGTAAYKLFTGDMDYSTFASALGTGADIWSSAAGEQSVAAARCLLLKTALAAVETVRSGSQASDAATVGDTSVTVGAGMVAVASGMTVAWTIAAGAAPTGPVGWCIGAVALTGGLIVTLTTDDDIEIYGRYCLYSRDRRTDWPTARIGATPYAYLKANADDWGQTTANGYLANLGGLFCYIFKVHSVEFTEAEGPAADDRVKLELHASPTGAKIELKVYYRPSGVTGAIGAVVGASSLKRFDITITRIAGRYPHATVTHHDLPVALRNVFVDADSSTYEVKVDLRLSNSDDRDNFTPYAAFARVYPFGTGEFQTPAVRWWKSGSSDPQDLP